VRGEDYRRPEGSMTIRLGFVGIGKMGLPMALRLVNQGYKLTIHDIRADVMQPLIIKDVRAVNTPAEVASEAEIVMVSLPSPNSVQEVALGPNGLINGSALKIYIDLSTTGPQVAAEVAKQLGKKGIITLDAPVSGGVPKAEKGTLTIMVSGPSQTFEHVRPILEVVGNILFFIGEKPGLGQMMKLVNNLLSATVLAASCEAFVLGTKAGLNPEVMLKVINSSTGRNSATEEKFQKFILSRTFDYGFKTDLIFKDLKLCLEQAEVLGVPMWIGNAVRQLWAYVVSQGGGTRDFTTIIQYIEAWAGVQVGKPVNEEGKIKM
jgi:3-hydroxyisobutyrate dehydrogenase-like beta-hydroxyacid dehydrogenase